MAVPNNYDSAGPPPPPVPPRTPSMFIEQPIRHSPWNSHHPGDSNPPPLPPRPGSSRTLGRQPHSSAALLTHNICDTSLPPTLPPKPSTLPRKMPRSTSFPVDLGTVEHVRPSPRHQVSLEQYDTVAVPLPVLTNELTNNIPSCIRVREFRSVHGAPSTLSEGDVLNLHFSKSTRVAYVQSISEMTLQVPVNSPMMCSVLYDPVDDMDRAESGYTFGSGTQLMNASPLPFFIGVLKGCKATKTTSQFNDNEILVVKGMHSNERHLKCLTIPDQEVKFVHTTTTACFTTDPKKIQVYLSEVVKHLEYQIKVKLYPQDPDLQQQMRKPYTLLDIGAQKSVIATYGKGCHKPQIQDVSDHILEIFLECPMKCEAVDLRPPEKQELIRKSRKIFQSFTPYNVNEIVVDIPSAVYTCQTLLFLSVEQVHGESLKARAPLIHTATLTGERPQHMPLPPPGDTQPISARYTQAQPTAPVPGPVPAPRIRPQPPIPEHQLQPPLQPQQLRPPLPPKPIAIKPPPMRDPIESVMERPRFPSIDQEG